MDKDSSATSSNTPSVQNSFTEERRVFSVGTGDWRFFDLPMERVHEAAADWKEQLTGVEEPWLCWNVDPDWSLVQQRQVKSVGWTPVVGFDPRVGPPPLVKGAILIDFNKRLKFPTMWMHFPLEFAHLFTKRLAFWHADLILRQGVAEKHARLFRSLRDGEMAATPDFGSLYRRIFDSRKLRYWEVLGCTTSGASASQFNLGCGWWKGFFSHPAHREDARKVAELSKYYWDCGVGIRYWQKKCNGKVFNLDFVEVNEGHCTGIGRKGYVRKSPNNELRNLSAELAANYELADVCKRLGVAYLLQEDKGG